MIYNQKMICNTHEITSWQNSPVKNVHFLPGWLQSNGFSNSSNVDHSVSIAMNDNIEMLLNKCIDISNGKMKLIVNIL